MIISIKTKLVFKSLTELLSCSSIRKFGHNCKAQNLHKSPSHNMHVMIISIKLCHVCIMIVVFILDRTVMFINKKIWSLFQHSIGRCNLTSRTIRLLPSYSLFRISVLVIKSSKKGLFCMSIINQNFDFKGPFNLIVCYIQK